MSQFTRARWTPLSHRLSSVAALLLGSAALVLSSPSSAAVIKAEQISAKQVAIQLSGEISAGDATRFRHVVAQHGQKSMFVILDSEGGLLPEALEIGELIRARGIGTLVPNGLECNSACALIWLAGKPRAMSKSAEIGFHAAYTMTDGGSPAESGVANAMVGRYLTLLDLPRSAVVFATTAPPDKLNYLTAYNFQALGMEARVVKDFGATNPPKAQASTVTPDKSPPTTYWKNAGGWTVGVDRTLNAGCFLINRFMNDTVFRVGIDSRADKSYYVVLTNNRWTSLKLDEEHELRFRFDTETPWDVPMKVQELGGLKVLMATFADPRFWAEFNRSKRMVVTRREQPVTAISLTGTSRAFNELVACQRTQNRSRLADPFAQ